jgi:hypothetical protein
MVAEQVALGIPAVGRTRSAVARLTLVAMAVMAVGAFGTIDAAAATKTVINFGELTARPVNGVKEKGVTFKFTIAGVASTDATYGGRGPGQLKYVQDPSLEGNAKGVLTLTWAKPTVLVQFGIARSSGTPLNPGVTVKLYDATGALIGTFTKGVAPIAGYPPFDEGLFSHTSTKAVAKAVITFNSPTSAVRFALDNLTYFV